MLPLHVEPLPRIGPWTTVVLPLVRMRQPATPAGPGRARPGRRPLLYNSLTLFFTELLRHASPRSVYSGPRTTRITTGLARAPARAPQGPPRAPADGAAPPRPPPPGARGPGLVPTCDRLVF